MDYHADGKIKLTDRSYPKQLYNRRGEIVIVNNKDEELVALAKGASLKVWDREKHQ
jgi:hypothetical protein